MTAFCCGYNVPPQCYILCVYTTIIMMISTRFKCLCVMRFESVYDETFVSIFLYSDVTLNSCHDLWYIMGSTNVIIMSQRIEIIRQQYKNGLAQAIERMLTCHYVFYYLYFCFGLILKSKFTIVSSLRGKKKILWIAVEKYV